MSNRIISEERLMELLEKEEMLYQLECAGVDNWQGYDDALQARDISDCDALLKCHAVIV